MVYANPVPRELINGEYYQRAGDAYYVTETKLKADYAEVRFERELRALRRHCRAGALLDVGCSSGGFLDALRRCFPKQYQAKGIDVSGPALDYAESRHLQVVRDDFTQHDFQGEQFDVVTFWAVLEHLSEPGRFLTRAHEVLKPGGVCFVLVPNLGSLAVRLLRERYRYILPEHINYFSAGTLRRLVTSVFPGEPVQCSSTHFNPAVLWQDWINPEHEPSAGERAALLTRTNALKANPWFWPAQVLYRFGEEVLGSVGLADNLLLVTRKTNPRP